MSGKLSAWQWQLEIKTKVGSQRPVRRTAACEFDEGKRTIAMRSPLQQYTAYYLVVLVLDLLVVLVLDLLVVLVLDLLVVLDLDVVVLVLDLLVVLDILVVVELDLLVVLHLDLLVVLHLDLLVVVGLDLLVVPEEEEEEEKKSTNPSAYPTDDVDPGTELVGVQKAFKRADFKMAVSRLICVVERK